MKKIIKFLERIFTTKTKTKLSAEYSDPSNPKLFMIYATEKINELVEGLKQRNARIVALQSSIAQITEERDTIKKELEAFKARHRHDVIAALLEDINFKDDESRNNVIQIWDKSGMDFEAIKHMAQTYREADRMREKTAGKIQRTSEKGEKQGQNGFNFIK